MRLDRMDDRFERIDQRFERMDQRLDGLTRWSIGTVIAVLVGAGAVIITLIVQRP